MLALSAVAGMMLGAVPPSALPGPGFEPAKPATPVWNGPGVAAGTGMVFTVVIDDPAGNLTPVAAGVHSNVLAAAQRWARFIDGTGQVSIVVRSADVPRASARSVTTGYVATRSGYDVFEQGWAYQVRTGEDPDGADYDIEIFLGTDYAVNNLWYDPAPSSRTAPIPPSRTDAVSVFIHELGHALAFNGWLNASDGTLPGDYRSTTDELTTFDDVPYFNGALASARYGGGGGGGPVPMTRDNWCHFGNPPPLPGSGLIPDLMNGVVYYYQTRYDISDLDLDLCADIGIAVTRACGPADLGSQGGFPGSDGRLDNNDFIVFITLFFDQDPAADLGVQGGLEGHDGAFNNNDFIAFITLFFQGC